LARRPLLLCLLILSVSPAFAADWQQPTPEELKLTSEPAAPNAEAIYLYREETNDDKLHMQSVYVRIKILRDEGKKYGDVEIIGSSTYTGITDIQGRTIHSDGTVIPFTGKPYEKLLLKTATMKYRAKVFSLPDVQTGSILEYRYKLRYEDNSVISPTWTVQQPIYVRKAHYHFVPTEREVISHTDNGNVSSQLAYSALLPTANKVVETRGIYDLDISNIPGLPKEQYEPPMQAFAYRVRFYYTGLRSSQQFWDNYGKTWAKRMDKFATPSPAITQAAQELTSAGGTQDQKLAKLYNAVMKLENTRFTREHSNEENRVEGIKQIKSAADVWTLKRGSSDDIALLFLSLARAAGFRAYAMAVVNRDRDFFQQNYLDGDQLDDLLVIVVVDGKERTFDPGERYMSYGELHWTHAMAGGLREQDGHTVIANAPGPGYKDTVIQRLADITLAPDGTISGSVSIICTGARAAHWRQKALEGDEVALKKEFDDELQSDLPSGVILHTDHFLGLDSQDNNLMVRINVSGALGTATGKRVFLPLSLFAAGSHNPFSSAKREEPIDLHYPYLETDQVKLRLPDGMQVESVPESGRVDLPKNAVYLSTVKADGQTITYTRQLIMANILYEASEYNQLKSFLDDVGNKDRAQAVLHFTAGAHTDPSVRSSQ
jgi:transglutaminase-like putative cysteine protease